MLTGDKRGCSSELSSIAGVFPGSWTPGSEPLTSFDAVGQSFVLEVSEKIRVFEYGDDDEDEYDHVYRRREE